MPLKSPKSPKKGAGELAKLGLDSPGGYWAETPGKTRTRRSASPAKAPASATKKVTATKGKKSTKAAAKKLSPQFLLLLALGMAAAGASIWYATTASPAFWAKVRDAATAIAALSAVVWGLSIPLSDVSSESTPRASRAPTHAIGHRSYPHPPSPLSLDRPRWAAWCCSVGLMRRSPPPLPPAPQ